MAQLVKIFQPVEMVNLVKVIHKLIYELFLEYSKISKSIFCDS